MWQCLGDLTQSHLTHKCVDECTKHFHLSEGLGEFPKTPRKASNEKVNRLRLSVQGTLLYDRICNAAKRNSIQLFISHRIHQGREQLLDGVSVGVGFGYGGEDAGKLLECCELLTHTEKSGEACDGFL
jgi:hypothetical protein